MPRGQRSGAADHAVFERVRGFDDEGQHHAVLDVLRAEVFDALRLDGRQQRVAVGRGAAAGFAGGVGFVAVKADAVFLSPAALAGHEAQGVVFQARHALGVTGRDHIAHMAARVHAHHVFQIGRAHGPAKGLHDLVHFHKVGAVAHQRRRIRRREQCGHGPHQQLRGAAARQLDAEFVAPTKELSSL